MIGRSRVTPLSPEPASVSFLSSDGSPPLSPNERSTEVNGFRRCFTAAEKRSKYLRRLFKFRHMDFEYALWQMLYLLIAPQKVYRNFHYRKQTRDQWARDDPAFLVLMTSGLIVTSLIFALIVGIHRHGPASLFIFAIWVIFVDCIAVGLVVATITWFIVHRFLRPKSGLSHGEDVEWGYAFDVHLNAFVPLIVVLHLLQLPFIHAIISHRDSILLQLLGNTFWLVAVLYYNYITFLGYSCLPYLENTRSLLYPMPLFVIIYILSLIFQWNFTKGLCDFYRHRVT